MGRSVSFQGMKKQPFASPNATLVWYLCVMPFVGCLMSHFLFAACNVTPAQRSMISKRPFPRRCSRERGTIWVCGPASSWRRRATAGGPTVTWSEDLKRQETNEDNYDDFLFSILFLWNLHSFSCAFSTESISGMRRLSSWSWRSRSRGVVFWSLTDICKRCLKIVRSGVGWWLPYSGARSWVMTDKFSIL